MSTTTVASPPAVTSPPGPAFPGPNTTAQARRAILRPKTLPGTRAVLGALLVTASALTAFVVTRQDNASPVGVPVAVATRSLPPGAVLEEGDVAIVTLDVPPAVAAAGFDSAVGLVGAVLRGPVGAGAVFDRVAVATGEDEVETGFAYREVSLAVPRSRALDGRVQPGDRVDLTMSTDAETIVIVQHATVVAVSGLDNELGASTDITLTLALPNPGDAVAVAHGGAQGELTVLRSTRAVDDLPGTYRPGTSTAVSS